MTNCDIIVVGAGSAGCILANRLAQRTGAKVILLEPPSQSAPAIDQQRPARWINLLGSVEDWNFSTEPSTSLAGRTLNWPRGRGLGGSSRINAMIWFPPTAADLDDLSAASGGAWSLAELTESVAQVERLVQPQPPRWLSESSRRFLTAASQRTDAQPMVYRRINRAGRRWNPAELLGKITEPAVDDPSIEIVRASVERLLFDGDDVIGVQVQCGSSQEQIRSRQGVVLCAGTVATPTILMRSGIGPQDVLRQSGIELRLDAERVGAGLQDHLIMPVIFQLAPHRRLQPSPSMRDLARWQTVGTGPVSTNLAECGGLFADGKFQIHVTPTHYLKHPHANSPAAMTIGVNVTRPASRGRLTITSADPNGPPRIDTGYLADETDLQATIDGVRLCREIANGEPLASWHLGEMLPGSRRCDDPSIAKSISRYAQTLYHPVGTCGMGVDNGSVVETSLRLRGFSNLWVADASILPRLPCGNPSAIVMAIAQRCGDTIADSLS